MIWYLLIYIMIQKWKLFSLESEQNPSSLITIITPPPLSPLPPYRHGLLFDEKNSSPNDLSFWKLRSLNTMKCLLLYPQFLILLTFPLNISHSMKNIYHLHHVGYKESKYFNKFVKYIFFWSTLVIDILKCTR